MIAALLLVAHLVTVTRVIDGDTVVIGKEHVRLLGINAPEIAHPGLKIVAQCFGAEATMELGVLVGFGSVPGPKRLRVERHGRDKYGRTLAYLWDGDVNLSAVMLEVGAARVYAPRHPKTFEALEAKARAEKLGLWENCAP